jgi:predicted N-acetyltransferase YhbS
MDASGTPRIEQLADYPHLAPTLARWHAEEWSGLVPEWTYENLLAELQSHTRPDAIPLTLVALDGDQPIGSASLVVEDLPGWEHLTPWLASVFVAVEARGRGIGAALVARAVETARDLGVERLHLFTEGQAEFYQRIGWRGVGGVGWSFRLTPVVDRVNHLVRS